MAEEQKTESGTNEAELLEVFFPIPAH